MRVPHSVDILIVGAGPTGLALGAELLRRGVPCLVVDAQPAGANSSRACVVHPRTLEVLEPLGLVPELLARGVAVPIFRVRDRDRALLSVDFRTLPSRYPYTLMLPQSDTEAVLLAGFEARGGQVLRPCRMLGLRAHVDGATVTLRALDGEHVVRARYLIGCDGTHSAVREQSAIGFVGGAYQESFALADVHLDWPLSREELSLFYAPAGLMVVAPIPRERFRIVATMKEAPALPSAADVQALLAARGPTGGAARVSHLIWSSRFHIQHRVARTFRSGRILILGDAAHVHSPAGGQGMNIGIQDAVSLGAALTAARDRGVDQELSAWAQRRQRVARGVVRLTDRMTRTATIESHAGQALRNAVLRLAGQMPGVRHAIAMRLSELSERAA